MKFISTNQLDNAPCLGYNLQTMPPAKKKRKKAAAWRLYILKCRDNTLYTGITLDVSRRVKQHNSGTASRYTRSRLPVMLLFSEPCRNRSLALKKEYAIKRLSREKKEEYLRENG